MDAVKYINDGGEVFRKSSMRVDLPMQTANSMLLDASRKLLKLHDDPTWSMELPKRCPPVLWFGNAVSPKPKVLTIGANPSRREFLTDTSTQAREKVQSKCDQSLLSYLEPPNNRFRILSDSESLEDIIESKHVQQQVIASYNEYFARNPFTEWFGHDRDSSYKVEGFLRGFGASYFERNTYPRQAIHIDLFPFTTISDFGYIRAMTEDAIFSGGWAQNLLLRLIEYLAPEVLILFGRTNCRYFGIYIDRSVSLARWQSLQQGSKYFLCSSESLKVPIVGLSTNLGNPKGFYAPELHEYGNKLSKLYDELKYSI